MQRDLIYDVGAHKGEDAEFYLRKGFRVVAIEAAPAMCDAIRARLGSFLRTKQLVLIEAAIAEAAGSVAFYANNAMSEFGTAHAEWARRNARTFGVAAHKITVRAIRFADVLREHGVPYYLKSDIEGSDLLCLRALSELNERPKYVSIESEKADWSALVGEFDLFRALGYAKFKLVQQEDVPKLACPRPPREGGYVDHAFGKGASGLFGDELPGDWLSEQEALQAYRSVFRRYRLFGDRSLLRKSRYTNYFLRFPICKAGWYDTHAAL
jgi:FkbM family methyltransferase